MAAPQRKQRSVAERRARALAMRAAGWPYQQIADQLGHKTASAAVQDVTRALQVAARQGHSLDAGLLLALELEKLDAAERSAAQIRAAAQAAGDQDTALRAIDRQLRIADRRARLLGLPAPAAPAAEPGESVIDQLAERRQQRRNRFSASG